MQTKSKIKNQKQKAKSKMNKGLLFTLFSFFISLNANAQCAMCRASLESNGDTKQAEAVNDGIVYLMAIPYVLVGLLGFIIYRMFAKKK
jgi:phosphatidylglycerophosphatase A